MTPTAADGPVPAPPPVVEERHEPVAGPALGIEALDDVGGGLPALPLRAPHHIWNGLPGSSPRFPGTVVGDCVGVRRRRFLVRDGRPRLLDEEVTRTVELRGP